MYYPRPCVGALSFVRLLHFGILDEYRFGDGELYVVKLSGCGTPGMLEVSLLDKVYAFTITPEKEMLLFYIDVFGGGGSKGSRPRGRGSK